MEDFIPIVESSRQQSPRSKKHSLTFLSSSHFPFPNSHCLGQFGKKSHSEKAKEISLSQIWEIAVQLNFKHEIFHF